MQETKDLAKSNYQTEIEIAWTEFEENKLLEAKDRIGKLIGVSPESAGTYYLLGHILLREKQIPEAINAFDTAVSRDIDGKTSGYIYYWLGQCYGMAGPFDETPQSVYNPEKQLEYFKLAWQAGNYPMHLLSVLRFRLPKEKCLSFLEEGVENFPDDVEPYLLLAQEYGSVGLINKQGTTLSEAIARGLSSATLFYQAGSFKVAQGDWIASIQHFEKAAELCDDAPNRSCIYYLLGRANFKANSLDQAELYFKRAYDNAAADDDKLFGFFGLLQVYTELGDSTAVESLISNLNVNENLFSQHGRGFGGPLYLDDQPVSIEIDNVAELYKLTQKIQLLPKNKFFSGKLWLIRSLLATALEKHYEAHKAIINARKYLESYHHPVVTKMHEGTLENLVYYKLETSSEVQRTLPIILSDLNAYSHLGNFLSNSIKYIVDVLYKAKDFNNIIAVSNFCSAELLFDKDVLFEVAYSHAELDNEAQAKVLYEHYIERAPNSTSVLNNLGLIYEHDGDIQKAIEVYEKGLVVEPTHAKIKNNLQRARQALRAEEQRLLKEKAQLAVYLRAVESVRNENDYVLGKLGVFIEQAKRAEGFYQWRLPIPMAKFHAFPRVDRQRGDMLREQWLRKEYITNTGDKNDYGTIIYAINPFLEAELTKLRTHKIPEKWLAGFENISINSLEELDYFELVERISKVNKKFQPLLERDFNELIYNYLMRHDKAKIVLSGSLVELVLTYYCERKKSTKLMITDKSGNQKTKNLYDCVLSDLIDYVEQTKSFGNDFIHLSNLSRIYRNFIHPGRELKDTLDSSKADICFVSTREIIRRIV